MTRPPVPVPSTMPLQRMLPSPRYLTSISTGTLTFDAPCPHGRIVEWSAIRDDARTDTSVNCNCEGAA